MMPLLKRNLILTNKEKNSSEMALLTIEKYNNTYNGTIKLYNIDNSNLLLAISNNNKQIFNKAISGENNVFTFSFNDSINLSDKLTSVLVKKENNAVTPIVWYTEEIKAQSTGSQGINEIVKNLNFQSNENFATSSFSKKDNITLPKTKPQPTGANSQHNNAVKNYNLDELFDISNEEEINQIIDESLIDKKQNNFIDEETKKLKNKGPGETIFFDLVSDQIEDLFSKYSNEPSLEKLIPNSKWVKVEYEDNSNPYVLGLIYDDIKLKYICYGIEGEFSTNPPKDLENYSQWLPLNPDNISLGGYWVMYQDALTGENIKIDLI